MITNSHAPPSPAAPHPSVRTRLARMRTGSFGPASEEPFRRRSRDAVRLVIATGAIVALARHVGDISPTEHSIVNFFNTLPRGLQSLFTTLYRLGALWAVGMITAAALLNRRWRLARDLAVAGGLAWGIARFIGVFVVESHHLDSSLDVLARSGNTPSFPQVRLAIVVAVIAAASPYVTRPTRRIGAVLIGALAVASMYLGTATPNDVLAGIVVGWGVAAAVHLIFGSPGGRPTTVQVGASLAQLGIDAEDVHLSHHQLVGSTQMRAASSEGPLWIKVIGRDEADAQFIAKTWRFIAYKDSGPSLFFSRLQQVVHEAYVLLLAGHAGVRVPDVVISATAGPSAALLVTRPIEGTALADMPCAAVTDELLDSVWEQVDRLRRARVVHGTLNTAHVLIGDDGPAIVEFGASVPWTLHRVGDDIAELLASTAAIVGEERAVAAAVHGLGPEAVADALPLLQPASLTRQTRALAAHHRKELHDRLEKLRELGAHAANTEPPRLPELHRVSATNLLLAVGTLGALVGLLVQVGNPASVWNTVQHADWVWVAAAFALAMLTNVAFAVALMGCVPIRLPLGPTTEVQIAMGFSNLAIPAIGGAAVQIRYLQKEGVDLASAIAAGGLLSTVGGVAVQIALFGIALLLTPDDIQLNLIPTSGILINLLRLALGLGVVTAAVLGIRRLRRVVVPPIMRAANTVWDTVRSPRRLGLLVAGNTAAALLAAASLAACLQAFGAHRVSFWTILALNIGIGTIASLVPIPGGGTAVSSVGLGGALLAFGVSRPAAVAAVLTNQLVSNYLPALPGWFATRRLVRHEYL